MLVFKLTYLDVSKMERICLSQPDDSKAFKNPLMLGVFCSQASINFCKLVLCVWIFSIPRK